MVQYIGDDMTDIIRTQPIALPELVKALPEPRTPITIRPGVLEDIPFIDQLQKKQSKQVGFFPTKAIEGKIALGHVLVACASRTCPEAEIMGETPMLREDRVGYVIGNDQYL